ncbi:MAG: hypothetical protein R6U39_03950, partial [Candidatus Aegiribacteria sp.]
YSAFPVRPGTLESSLAELFSGGIRGLNVTFPYKMESAGLCDELEGDALRLGAVNTLEHSGGVLRGFNTDAYGFRRCVDRLSLKEPFFLVGCGGGALAADLALAGLDIERTVFCRNPGGWRGLAEARPLRELEGKLQRSTGGTVVNATTLGWVDGDDFPVSPPSMAGTTFLDLNYNPDWSWRNRLAESGVIVFTGETMLVFQAAGSFEIWTGRVPDADKALRAVRSGRRNGDGIEH